MLHVLTFLAWLSRDCVGDVTSGSKIDTQHRFFAAVGQDLADIEIILAKLVLGRPHEYATKLNAGKCVQALKDEIGGKVIGSAALSIDDEREVQMTLTAHR